MPRMPLFLALLILALSAAAAPLSIGPAIPLIDPVIEPAPFHRAGPHVASNGRDFLAVWWDARGGGYPYQIRAARIDRDGNVLDPTGIAVGFGNEWVSVASDGRDYLVAYNCSNSVYDATVCLARIEAETGRIAAHNKIERAWNPILGSNGSNYLIAYAALDPARGVLDLDLNGAIVSRDANAVGQPFRLAGSHQTGAAIASNGEVYFVAWSIRRYLTGAIVSGEGSVKELDSVSTKIAGFGPSVFSWSVASDGDGFLVAWHQNAGLSNSAYVTDLRVRAFSATGQHSQERTLAESGPGHPWNVSASWNGEHYLVAYTATDDRATAPVLTWSATGDVRAVTADSDGDPAAPPSTIADRTGREVTGAVASNDRHTLVVWEHEHRGIEGRFVRRNGQPEHNRIVVAKSVTWQQEFASAGETLAWEEIVGEEQRRKVFVKRVGDPGRGVEVEPSMREQVHPAAGGALVAWLQVDVNRPGPQEVLVKRLAHLDEPPLLLDRAAQGSRVAVGWTGKTHLVVWVSESREIHGARFNAEGMLIDSAPIVLSSGPRNKSNPVIATDGAARFLVLWNRGETLEGFGCAIDCPEPLSLNATMVTAAGFVTATLQLGEPFAGNAFAVWNGTEFAVFWSKQETLLGRRIDRLGNLREVLPVVVRESALVYGAAWTGREYLLATSGHQYRREPLAVARVDNELRLTESVVVASPYVHGTRVVFFPRAEQAMLMVFQAIGEDLVSRATGRLAGDHVNPPRRRAVAGR